VLIAPPTVVILGLDPRIGGTGSHISLA